MSVREPVKHVIAQVMKVHTSELDDDVLIREELGVDSLRAMEIIALCERELELDIDETSCIRMETVGEFLAYVEGLWQEDASGG